MTVTRFARAVRPHAFAIALALAAIAIAWAYAATTLHTTRELGLPLDDSYIYFTYAKQIGRGQPLTYFAGSGYSAGATSITWPVVLAPIWALGARGHALVWGAFVLCALLYAASAVLVYRIAIAARAPAWAAVAAGAIVVCIAPFAWTALSGMEVAITSALLLAMTALLLARESEPAPSRWLVACLVAAALARPEAAVLVAFVCGTHAIAHRRHRKAMLLWLAPLIAPALWLVANRVLAGHWLPSTAIAKSQMFQPGFAWSAWWSAFATNAGKLVNGLWWDPLSPLPQARLFSLLWLVGAVRLVAWARAQRSSGRVATAVILGGPLLWCALVLASSGLWTLHQFRYITPVFPLLAVPVAIAISPVARWPWSRWASLGCALVVVAAAIWFGAHRHGVSARTFAQGAADTNAQVVKIGRYLRAKVPASRVMLHDAGAIAYYSDAPVIDMLGLVTDATEGVAGNGAGARFEWLEALSPEARPTHIAYYPGWLGAPDFMGALVMDTPLGPQFARERVVGGKNMELVVASWDHAGTGERPLQEHPGWSVVDRVDIADLASERAHAWTGALGVRRFADPTARWSFVARDVTEHGLVLDGGRTIRGARETFTIGRDAAKPAKLIVRTGGAASAEQDVITRPIELAISVDGKVTEQVKLPAPSGRMVDIEIALPPGGTQIAIRGEGPYRVFHWFVLQPD